MPDVVEVTPLEGYRLRLRFEDGAVGEVDVSKIVRFEGVFATLRVRERFLEVKVEPEAGTICWPGGADLDPEVLYSLATGTPIEIPETARSR